MDSETYDVIDSADILNGAVLQLSEEDSDWEIDADSDVINSSLCNCLVSKNDQQEEKAFPHKKVDVDTTFSERSFLSLDDVEESLHAYNKSPNIDKDALDNTIYITDVEPLLPVAEITKKGIYQAEKMYTSFSQNFDDTTWSNLSSSMEFTNSSLCKQLPQDEFVKSSVAKDVINIILTSETDLVSIEDLIVDHCYTNLIACVLHCFPVKEVWVKTRRCWQCMSVILLTDFSGLFVKLTLWDNHCKYAFTVQSGDIIFINCFKTKFLMNDKILCLNAQGKVLCVGAAKSLNDQNMALHFQTHVWTEESKAVTDIIYKNSQYFVKKYPSVYSHPVTIALPPPNQEKCNELCRSSCGRLVDVQLTVVGVKKHKYENKNTPSVLYGHFRNSPMEFCNLFLHGSTSEWADQLIKMHKTLWEFQNVACCLSSSTDRLELHCTVFSSAQCVLENDLNISTRIPCIVESHHFSATILLTDVTVQCITFLFSRRYTRIHKRSSQRAKEKWVKHILKNDCKGKVLHNLLLNCNFCHPQISSTNLKVSIKTMRSILLKKEKWTTKDGQVPKTALATLMDLLQTPQSFIVGIILERDMNFVLLEKSYELLSISKL